MAYIIQHRRDTAENWTRINPVLADAEVGYISDFDGDGKQKSSLYKIGDGRTAWNDLPIFGFNGNVYDNLDGDDLVNSVATRRVVKNISLSVDGLKDDLKTTNENISTVDDTLKNLNDTVSTLNTTTEALNNDIQGFKDYKEDNDDNISLINTNITDLDTRIDNMESKFVVVKEGTPLENLPEGTIIFTYEDEQN